MITYRIGLSGPGARGARVDGALLRDLLAVLVDGVTQSVRLRVEGRSTAQGKLPAWLERAAAFDVLRLESGSTELLIEAPRLIDAAPDAFAQGHLFSEIDATRTGYDLLTEGLTDVVEGKTDSDRYDDRLIHTFESFALVLWGRPAQVSGVAKLRPSGAVLRIDAERIEPASTEDLALWSLEPVPAFGPLDERVLAKAQGPCSGVSALFGQLREVEEDDAAIIKALDEFS